MRHEIKDYERIAFNCGLVLGVVFSFLGVLLATEMASGIDLQICFGILGFAIGNLCGQPLTLRVLLTPSKRRLINSEIASFGPPLFDLVMSRKIASGWVADSFGTRSYITEPNFQANESLEQKDLLAAIRSKHYSPEELAILRYIAGNISTIGHRVGYMVVACGHHGTSVDYYAVNRQEIAGIAS